MQIGLAHQQRLTKLRQVLTTLKDVATGEFAAAFDTQLQRLDSWTARIAAIGQVKAGKSRKIFYVEYFGRRVGIPTSGREPLDVRCHQYAPQCSRRPKNRCTL